MRDSCLYSLNMWPKNVEHNIAKYNIDILIVSGDKKIEIKIK